MKGCASVLWAALIVSASALRYDPNEVDYNLNQNQQAINPVDYDGKWEDHEFHPSPLNWRFPFYTAFLDRFVNGDPTNGRFPHEPYDQMIAANAHADDANGTHFEHDLNGNQLRHGGDVQGFVDSLDYLQGMGIRGLYLAGSAFINLPWEYDGKDAA